MAPSYQCESFCDHRWNKKDFEQVCDYARYRFGDIACPKCGHKKIVGWKTFSKEDQARLKKEAIVMQEMYYEAQKQLWEADQAKKQNKKFKKRRIGAKT